MYKPVAFEDSTTVRSGAAHATLRNFHAIFQFRRRRSKVRTCLVKFGKYEIPVATINHVNARGIRERMNAINSIVKDFDLICRSPAAVAVAVAIGSLGTRGVNGAVVVKDACCGYKFNDSCGLGTIVRYNDQPQFSTVNRRFLHCCK